MLKEIGSQLGDIVGKKIAERYDRLEDALDYLFSWEKDFSMEIEDGKVTTSGQCPVGRFYPKFCEEGCLEFIEEVAKHYGAKVSRVSTEPCTFEFS